MINEREREKKYAEKSRNILRNERDKEKKTVNVK